MDKVCQCCGQTLPPEPLALKGLKLNGNRLEIYKRVLKAGRHGVTSLSLFEMLYGDDPDGGPLSTRNIISVYVCQLNHRLVPLGQKIVSEGRVGPHIYARYRIENVPARAD